MLPVLTTKTEDPDGMDSTVELVECSPEQKIERVESFPNVSLIKTCFKINPRMPERSQVIKLRF